MLFAKTLLLSGLLAAAHAIPARLSSKEFEIQFDGQASNSFINAIEDAFEDKFEDVKNDPSIGSADEEFDISQFEDGLTVEEVVRKVNAKELSIKCATTLGEAGHCVTSNCTTAASFAVPSKCQGDLGKFMICCPDQPSDEVRVVPKVTECGVRPVKTGNLIVGGVEARPNSWPWAAQLYRVAGKSRYFICGGSIINDQYILTAAHCVKRGSGTVAPASMMIKLGAHKLSGENSGEFYEVEEVTPHEHYSPVFHNDDIALLKLKKKIEFNEQRSPVCLPDESSPNLRVEGKMATMIGWGTHSEGSMSPSATLYEVLVPISNQDKCKNAYTDLLGRNTIFDWNNVICAAYDQGGKDTCQGDSGGSMTVPDATNKYTQVGVVSFGYGCAQKGYPGVYTYTQNYVAWIGAHTRV